MRLARTLPLTTKTKKRSKKKKKSQVLFQSRWSPQEGVSKERMISRMKRKSKTSKIVKIWIRNLRWANLKTSQRAMSETKRKIRPNSCYKSGACRRIQRWVKQFWEAKSYKFWWVPSASTNTWSLWRSPRQNCSTFAFSIDSRRSTSSRCRLWRKEQRIRCKFPERKAGVGFLKTGSTRCPSQNTSLPWTCATFQKSWSRTSNTSGPTRIATIASAFYHKLSRSAEDPHAKSFPWLVKRGTSMPNSTEFCFKPSFHKSRPNRRIGRRR